MVDLGPAPLHHVYADPWNYGYYDVEQSARDGHFWYRMAQHYRNPQYLWAAEQVVLGGRPPDGKVPAEYQAEWWQEERIRVLLCFHQDGAMRFGTVRQQHSQDTDPNLTCFGWRPVHSGKVEDFLSVLVPHSSGKDPRQLAAEIQTRVSESGDSTVRIHETKISIKADGTWNVVRGAQR